MNDITILHLSDLHIDKSSKTYSRLLQGLLVDIGKEIKSVPDKSLVVTVTGDIIHQGEKDACIAALKFFTDLKSKLGNKVIGIYIVPGNHDKYRTKENDFLIPAYRTLIEHSNPNKNKFDRGFYDSFWHFQMDTYGEVSGSGYLKLVSDIYKIFEMCVDVPEKGFQKNTFGADILNVLGKNYCFVLLNTAWSCVDENDNRNLILGKFQIDETKKQFRELMDSLNEAERTCLTFVLGHHPIGCLQGNEEDRIFTEMISYEALDANAYICGHTHDRAVINWVNNRHSLNTFMTGIGWPEKDSGNNVGIHTYSRYVFNLDANSVDIYVRSTNDGGIFTPDLRIYTNENSGSRKKIVFPIRAQEAHAYLPLSTRPDGEEKAFYISDDFLNYIRQYNMQIGHFRQIVGSMIEADKSEVFENLEYDTAKYPDTSNHVVADKDADTYEELVTDQDELLFNYFFAQTADDFQQNEELIKEIFKDNKNMLFDMFLGFLQKICQKLQQVLVSNLYLPGDIVRVHLRYLVDRGTFLYTKLCTSFPEECDSSDLEISDIKFGDLIEAAYIAKKPLVYSVNCELCNQRLKDKWTNFITVVPHFKGNEFERRYSEDKTKKVPFITFGVTTNSEKFDNLLYCMDFFSINSILEDILNIYINVFKIDIDQFCIWVRNQYKKEGGETK